MWNNKDKQSFNIHKSVRVISVPLVWFCNGNLCMGSAILHLLLSAVTVSLSASVNASWSSTTKWSMNKIQSFCGSKLILHGLRKSGKLSCGQQNYIWIQNHICHSVSQDFKGILAGWRCSVHSLFNSSRKHVLRYTTILRNNSQMNLHVVSSKIKHASPAPVSYSSSALPVYNMSSMWFCIVLFVIAADKSMDSRKDVEYWFVWVWFTTPLCDGPLWMPSRDVGTASERGKHKISVLQKGFFLHFWM